MARFFVDFWGPKFELTNADVQGLVANRGNVAYISGLLSAAALASVKFAWVAPVIGAIAKYIEVQLWLIERVNGGSGVWLTLPWPAIYFGQWWLIVPTRR